MYFVIKVVIKSDFNRKQLWSNILCVALLMTACGRSGSGEGSAGADTVALADDFHADNDIAMTVRSIADAIRVGEPLDTTDYNFSGVLTDGVGRPLYTNLQGAPGIWDVDVLSKTSAVVRNVDIGDLLPDDLERYVASSLGLTQENLIDSLEYNGAEGAETAVYDFGGGYLRIDVRNSSAANGLEGALVSITASRDLPSPRH